jgi:hypothetical protein
LAVDARGLRDLLQREPGLSEHDEGAALLQGQRLDRGDKPFRELARFHLVKRRRTRVGDHHRRVVLARRQRDHLLPAKMVPDLVARDGEQPGREVGPARIEVRRVSRNRDPGLLMQILGGVGAGGGQHSADELETGTVITVIEPGEGMGIAGDMRAQQLGVVREVRVHQVPV